MKVQLIQCGPECQNRYMLRTYTFGFIPLYWYPGRIGEWRLSKFYMSLSEARLVIERFHESKRYWDKLNNEKIEIVIEQINV